MSKVSRWTVMLGAGLVLLSIAGGLCACGSYDYAKYSGTWVGTLSGGPRAVCVIIQSGSTWTAQITTPGLAGSAPMPIDHCVAKRGKLVRTDAGRVGWYRLDGSKLLLEGQSPADPGYTFTIAEFSRQ